MPHAALKRGILRSLAWLLLASTASAGSLSVTASQRNGQPVTGAVVMVHSLTSSPTLPHVAPVKGVLDQVDLAFVPDVLVVPVNSSVLFPNSDAISHQVYSFSPAKSFQLPLYRGKAYPPVTFEKPGVITIGCNIHDDMLAYIVVTDAPFFGRTDARGMFIAANVPAGHYRVSLWHPRLSGEAAVDVMVGAGDQSASLALKRNLRPVPLGGKPRSWDY